MAKTNLWEMRKRACDPSNGWRDIEEPTVPPITRGELTDILDELEQLRAQDNRLKRDAEAKEPVEVKGARELSFHHPGVLVEHTIFYRDGEKVGEGTNLKP